MADVSERYRVVWTLDVEAESPLAAAREALAIQRDPEGIATVFDVYDDTGDDGVRVDLVKVECDMGLHSWIDKKGKLPPTEACTLCGELYGDPT